MTARLRGFGPMAALLLGMGMVLVLSSACVSTPPVRTYADMQSAVARRKADYYRSKLTDRPQRHHISSDYRYELFYRLPLSERAVVVMDSFAWEEFDGEYAFTMWVKLSYRSDPSGKMGSSGMLGPSPRDRAYTVELFRIIESYPDEKVREFCATDEGYARFHRNLRRWKAKCWPSS